MVYVNFLGMRWKDYLYFSPAEKIAVLILAVIIVLSFGLNVLLSRRSSEPISIPQNDSLIAAFERLQESLVDKEIKSRSYDNKPTVASKKNRPNERVSSSNRSSQSTNNTQKPRYIRQEKFTEPGSISLNETDTTEWKKVPGIGSSFSRRIVKYRSLLGGYVSINQLKEVYGVTDELFDAIAPFIHEDGSDIGDFAKININQLEFKEILAHPYINYEQTKAIVNLRRRIGAITSTNQLAMLDEFTSEDIERITPYLEF
ncbi:MAG TPA: helix-hairpin-helix domain-containing protein [Bacteroidales bacterium]|nr:helix-hairpin-helix domain-containing protein [Bacteroidales bacterium]